MFARSQQACRGRQYWLQHTEPQGKDFHRQIRKSVRRNSDRRIEHQWAPRFRELKLELGLKGCRYKGLLQCESLDGIIVKPSEKIVE